MVAKWKEGYSLVQGCRLPAGGGRILPGAMPFLHRWLGNPLFSFLAKVMFRSPIHDIYCGLRGFTPELYQRLELRCTGMEFATEMIIKASLRGEQIAEVPITLRPDGRKTHPPHLRTFRDGWRTLRFFLLCSPRWLFLVPGFLLILLGILGYVVAVPGLTIGGINFDAHTLLVASLFLLLGYQAVLSGVASKTFAIHEGFLPRDPRLERFFEIASLERVLLFGLAGFLTGVGLLLYATNLWREAHFGTLDYAYTMRWVIPGVTLCALGFQTAIASFLLGVLAVSRK
jgi:hypothetical protein